MRYSAIALILSVRSRLGIIGVMSNVYGFVPGDLLIFQIESGFGLLRVLDVETSDAKRVWHLTVYRDLFQDVEMAEIVAAEPANLNVEFDHIALTDRAFESTQVSRLGNFPLEESESAGYRRWQDGEKEVSDRSVRLHLGFR